MLFATELFPLDEYQKIMAYEDDGHPLPLALNAVNALLSASHNFRAALNELAIAARDTIVDDDRHMLDEVARQPQFFLRGHMPQTDMYADEVPLGWNYDYLSTLLQKTGDTLEETFGAFASTYGSLQSPAYIKAINKVWSEYGALWRSFSQLNREIGFNSDYDRKLREEDHISTADTVRDLIRQLLNTNTGYVEGRALDEGIAPQTAASDTEGESND